MLERLVRDVESGKAVVKSVKKDGDLITITVVREETYELYGLDVDAKVEILTQRADRIRNFVSAQKDAARLG
jgi:hypothetical protein